MYLLATGDRAVLRIRASTGQSERVVDLKNCRATGEWGWLLALAPDDSVLLLRDAGTQGCVRPRLGTAVDPQSIACAADS